MKSKLATQSVNFGEIKSNPRTEKVIKITPHHMASKMLADDCAKMHRDSGMQCSANYYIGYDGTICAGVDENRRAWTSASKWNDQRAITIEVSNDGGAPSWHISDAAYEALVDLCADICKRYGISPYYNGTTDGTITFHQMFASTDCPGMFLLNKIHSRTFQEDILRTMEDDIPIPDPDTPIYRVQTGAFRDRDNAETRMDAVMDEGFEAYMIKADGLYKIQCGAFKIKENAENLAADLQKHGFDTYITTKSGEAVPPAKYYIVQEGDTLGEIAANYGTSIEALLQLNPSINDPDLIYVGQKIRIS